MKKVAIVGVGLIGGSFALAIRRAGFSGEILGVSSSSTVLEALRLGVIDRGATLDEAAAEADLLYLAQPISEIVHTIEALAGRVSPLTLVTDAGSTKGEIVALGKKQLGSSFLGGHPMAGKELRGVGAAEAGLFVDRTYFLCCASEGQLEHPVARELVEFVRRIGANPVFLEAAKHDRLVSLTSHLSQLSSTALAACIARAMDFQSAREGAGPGLIDMTRLAQSSYGLWADILKTNTSQIDEALSLYISELQHIRSLLDSKELGSIFEQAGNFSRYVRKPGT
jgi:prephenate dehydrogenase